MENQLKFQNKINLQKVDGFRESKIRTYKNRKVEFNVKRASWNPQKNQLMVIRRTTRTVRKTQKI